MKWQGLLLSTTLLAAGASAEPPPVLLGVRQVSDLGLVEFTATKGGHVAGKYKAEGECHFKPDEVVIDGVIDGTLFVGNATVCQTGDGCAKTRRYPFLGVFANEQMLGHIKMDQGCTSPGVTDGKIVVVEASVEDREKLIGTDGMSASDVANRGSNSDQRLREELRGQLEDAQKALEAKDYAKAKTGFERVVKELPESWEAHLGVGIAKLHLKDSTGALVSMDRALTRAHGGPGSGQNVALVQFNRACALTAAGKKNEALGALGEALKLGGAEMVAAARTDSDLAALRREPGYRRLVEEARRNRNNR